MEYSKNNKKRQKKFSINIKNSKLKFKNILKNIKNLILNIDIDFIFVLLASFLLLKYSFYQRVLFSVGISYIYKMIIKDIKSIIEIKRKK